MKIILHIFSLMLFMTSCVKSDIPVVDGEYIHLGANYKSTKGAAIETIEELPYFNVLAYYHKGGWANLSASNPAVVYMDNVQVSKENGSWVYSPIMSWSNSGNLSFFAYYPASSLQNGVTTAQFVDGTLPKLTYSVPEIVENQPDIMVSTTSAFDLNRGNTSSGVNFRLAHALTCVSFLASGEGEYITDIKLSGVVATGTITIGEPTIDWSLDRDDTYRTFNAGVNGQILDSTPSSIINNDGLLMMLPQTLTDAATLTITIDDGDNVYDKSFALNIPGYNIWRAGEVVEYNFAISSTGSIIMNPSKLTLQSTAEASSVFAIISPIGSEDTEWSVSTDDGGWLRIYDHPQGVNDDASQTNPYNYNGKGSKLLYAYAESSNSGGVERVSHVRLASGKQQISVTQLAENQIYRPSVSDGWAGSNVYWVVDNSMPDGGYLTFADRGDTSKEHYQGVYFVWGSLVALSPMGTNWTGQILHIPNTNSSTNGGWDTSNKGWNYIPRLGVTNPLNPNNTIVQTVIEQNNGQNYLYQKHNAKGNVGDICKYITDRGWAPGVHQGRKWRMPTHYDYSINQVGLMRKLGDFVAKASNNPNGQEVYSSGFERPNAISPVFLPASGFRSESGTVYPYEKYRQGESMFYWFGSPTAANKVGANPLYYWLGIANTVVEQTSERTCGATIRCVEE